VRLLFCFLLFLATIKTLFGALVRLDSRLRSNGPFCISHRKLDSPPPPSKNELPPKRLKRLRVLNRPTFSLPAAVEFGNSFGHGTPEPSIAYPLFSLEAYSLVRHLDSLSRWQAALTEEVVPFLIGDSRTSPPLRIIQVILTP